VPRYFFNILEGHSKDLVRDPEGAVFSGLGGARKEAIGLARDFARHGFRGPMQTCTLIVTDENGYEVLRVPLSEIRPHKFRAWFDLRGCVSRFESSFGPRILVWLVAAAMLAIIAQTAIKMVYVAGKGGNYQTASALTDVTIVAVRFYPYVSVADISKFLEAYKASLVDGPRPGAFYHVRVEDTALLREDLAETVGRMAQEKVVEFVAIVQ
jgi:hypothetical protein